jgi:hypothetical protein
MSNQLIDKKQIKILRTLASKVFKNGNDEYHAWLQKSFFDDDNRKSTTELTATEAREAINILMRYVSKPGATVSRYKGSNNGVNLTYKQAAKISFMETALGWADNFARMQGFIFKQTGKNKSVEMLSIGEAQKVITGLERILGDQK